MAARGFGSRRKIEEEIATGQIEVNGEVPQPGYVLQPGDIVRRFGGVLHWEGKSAQEPPQVIIYRKAEGTVVSRDGQGMSTVFERLPRLKHARWIAVGRLDVNSAGLLLFTTDGELAQRLMHPSSELEREYRVRVLGELSRDAERALREGVELEDGAARFEQFERLRKMGSAGDDFGDEGRGATANQWYRVVLKSGRNRMVRRMFESQGLQVNRLLRTRYGKIELPRGMKPGSSRPLSESEMRLLYRSVDMKKPSGGKR